MRILMILIGLALMRYLNAVRAVKKERTGGLRTSGFKKYGANAHHP